MATNTNGIQNNTSKFEMQYDNETNIGNEDSRRRHLFSSVYLFLYIFFYKFYAISLSNVIKKICLTLLDNFFCWLQRISLK